MDEQDWRQRLTAAAEREAAAAPDLDGDVARGRAALRARRLAVYGGGGLAVAMILVSGAALGQLSAGRPTSTSIPAAGNETAGATFESPSPVESPRTPEEQVSKIAKAREDLRRAQARAEAQHTLRGTADFRFGLYDIVADHLDPEKKYLNYATRSLQTSGGADGTRGLGIKLGWKVPGETGEGLVQIGVSNMKGLDDMFACAELVEEQCRTVDLPSGETVEVGERGDGSYSVLHRRSNGESVRVIVNPLFGNNSRVPVEEMRIEREEVFRLVQDERITLPEG